MADCSGGACGTALGGVDFLGSDPIKGFDSGVAVPGSVFAETEPLLVVVVNAFACLTDVVGGEGFAAFVEVCLIVVFLTGSDFSIVTDSEATFFGRPLFLTTSDDIDMMLPPTRLLVKSGVISKNKFCRVTGTRRELLESSQMRHSLAKVASFHFLILDREELIKILFRRYLLWS